MKKGLTIGLIGTGLALLGAWIWTKVSQVKNFASSLVVTPMWYGKAKDMKVSLQGVKLPLAVDLNNRSDLSVDVKVNSFDIVNSAGKVLASNTSSTDNVTIPANGTGRVPIDVWINLSTLITIISGAYESIANGDFDIIKEKMEKLIDGCTMKFGVTINGAFNINLDLALDEDEEIDTTATQVVKQASNGLGLVCAQDRKIGSLADYEHLIPDESELRRKDAFLVDDVTPEETAKFIRKMAKRYKGDTERLAYALERPTIEETIQSIYDFVFAYVKYTEDAPDREQLRRPLRTLYDQKGDCDCYSLLVASICENLDLDYKVRIAEYDHKGYYQHVYIIIEGMVCDPVIDRCFKEKKPSKKRDF